MVNHNNSSIHPYILPHHVYYDGLLAHLHTCINIIMHIYSVSMWCFVQVKELVRLSLNLPVRLFVDSNTDVADNLRQEFVRIKTKKEGDRKAIVTGIII